MWLCVLKGWGWSLHTALLKHMATRAGEWVERLDSAGDAEWVELYRAALKKFTDTIETQIVMFMSLDSVLVKTQLVETVGCLVSQRQIQRLLLHIDTIGHEVT